MDKNIQFLTKMTSKKQYFDRESIIDYNESKMRYTQGLIYIQKLMNLLKILRIILKKLLHINTHSALKLAFLLPNKHKSYEPSVIEMLILNDYFINKK